MPGVAVGSVTPVVAPGPVALGPLGAVEAAGVQAAPASTTAASSAPSRLGMAMVAMNWTLLLLCCALWGERSRLAHRHRLAAALPPERDAATCAGVLVTQVISAIDAGRGHRRSRRRAG